MKPLITCFIFIFASTSFSGTGEDLTKYQYLNPEKNYPSSDSDSDSSLNERELKAYARLNDALPESYRVKFDRNEIYEGESDDEEEIQKSLDELNALINVKEKDETLATEEKSNQTSLIEQSETSTIRTLITAANCIHDAHLNRNNQNNRGPDDTLSASTERI
jgi:vacuolar-type H+-ATPase subunit I/STV1